MSRAVPGDGLSEYDGEAERWDGGDCLSHCYTAVKRNHDRSDTGESIKVGVCLTPQRLSPSSSWRAAWWQGAWWQAGGVL